VNLVESPSTPLLLMTKHAQLKFIRTDEPKDFTAGQSKTLRNTIVTRKVKFSVLPFESSYGYSFWMR
jgi:hypothetical protein